MNLQLEYTCTEAEMEEAKSLHLRQQCGGGPKWRSRLVLYASLALGVVLIYLRFKMEVAAADRLWVIAVAIAVFISILILQHFTGTKSPAQMIHLEISEREWVFVNGGSRTVTPWSAFGKCLETQSLFVLLDRPEMLLYVLPKRAFPDKSSQDWFRSLATQARAVAELSGREPSIPARLGGTKGVALTVQLKFRDYVVRMMTSWRTKGIGLFVLLLMISTCLFGSEPANAVNSRGKTLLIMLGMMTPLLTVAFLIVSFISWRTEKKYLAAQHVALTLEGIEFSSVEGSGFLVWSTYKYYLENRWSFFVWNPRGSLWFMFPKREFSSLYDLRQCRELLQNNLQRSRWFFL